jgi:hypothetical protein
MNTELRHKRIDNELRHHPFIELKHVIRGVSQGLGMAETHRPELRLKPW